MGNDPIELLFVCAKIPPALLVSPDRGAGCSHTGIASGQGLGKFLLPALDDAVQIKSAFCGIPRIVGKYFYATFHQVAIKIRHRLPQRPSGVLLRQGLSEDPQAELVVFQPGLEIGH